MLLKSNFGALFLGLAKYIYSRTSRKRRLIMSRICGRLREVVAYQRSDHREGGGGGGLLIEIQGKNFSLDCLI